MSCYTIRKLTDFVYGEVDKEEKDVIEWHINACSECHLVVSKLYEEQHLLSEVLRPEAMPSWAKQRLKHALQRWRYRRVLRYLATAAAVLLVAALVTLFLHQQPPTFQEIPIPWSAFTEGETVLEDGSILRVTPKTNYQIKGYRKLRLNYGELWLDVVRKEGNPFNIETPCGNVVAKGTEFVVQVLRKDSKIKVRSLAVGVLVISGVVELENSLGREVGFTNEYLYAQQDTKPQKKQADQQKPKQEDIKPKQIAKGAKLIIWGGHGAGGALLEDGAVYDIQTDRWKKMPEAPISGGHSKFVISGTKLIIWGQTSFDGAIYDLKTNRWKELPEPPIDDRSGFTVISSGTKVIIWGGFRGARGRYSFYPDGAIYDVEKDKWEEIECAEFEGLRMSYTCVLSGNKLIVWGGHDGGGGAYCDGAIYDLKEGEWEEMPETPLISRYGHISALHRPDDSTGSAKLIIWGGHCTGAVHADGAIYDIKNKKWNMMSPAPIEPRTDYAFTVFDTKIIIWGGLTQDEVHLSDGAIYDMSTDSWEKIPKAPIDGRYSANLIVPAGTSKLIVWGGKEYHRHQIVEAYFEDGAIYDLGSKKWEKMPENDIIGGRSGHTFIVSRTKLIIWGGKAGHWYLDDGAIYDIQKGEWQEMAEPPIEARWRHISVLVQGK
jgi:N-acetylneuraminic acid mutarotase